MNSAFRALWLVNSEVISKYYSPPSNRRERFSTFLTSCHTYIGSSISAKIRSLYLILDLLYFMLPYTMRHPTAIVHDTFCFSHSISWIWDANLTIFCCFDKKVNNASFDFRSCVCNIQVLVFSFVRHPSAIHWERTSRAQVISTPLPTVALAINPPVEWSRENDLTQRRKPACVHSLKMAEREHADASAASLIIWCQNDHRRNTPIHRARQA